MAGAIMGVGSTPQTLSGERGSGSQNSLRLRCSRTCSTHALPKELYDSLRKIKQYWWERFPTQALYIPRGSSRLSSCNQTLSSFGTHVSAKLVNVSNASGCNRPSEKTLFVTTTKYPPTFITW